MTDRIIKSIGRDYAYIKIDQPFIHRYSRNCEASTINDIRIIDRNRVLSTHTYDSENILIVYKFLFTKLYEEEREEDCDNYGAQMSND